MSKKQYIEAFSNIHPSDESIERIMNMTNKKCISGFRKALVIIAVVVTIFCSIGLVANAATDGAVAETISEVAESVSKKITVIVNGKESKVDLIEETNADGETCYIAEIKSDGDTKGDFIIKSTDDKDVYKIDYVLEEGIKKAIATTEAK